MFQTQPRSPLEPLRHHSSFLNIIQWKVAGNTMFKPNLEITPSQQLQIKSKPEITHFKSYPANWTNIKIWKQTKPTKNCAGVIVGLMVAESCGNKVKNRKSLFFVLWIVIYQHLFVNIIISFHEYNRTEHWHVWACSFIFAMKFFLFSSNGDKRSLLNWCPVCSWMFYLFTTLVGQLFGKPNFQARWLSLLGRAIGAEVQLLTNFRDGAYRHWWMPFIQANGEYLWDLMLALLGLMWVQQGKIWVLERAAIPGDCQSSRCSSPNGCFLVHFWRKKLSNFGRSWEWNPKSEKRTEVFDFRCSLLYCFLSSEGHWYPVVLSFLLVCV